MTVHLFEEHAKAYHWDLWQLGMQHMQATWPQGPALCLVCWLDQDTEINETSEAWENIRRKYEERKKKALDDDIASQKLSPADVSSKASRSP